MRPAERQEEADENVYAQCVVLNVVASSEAIGLR